jgi:hypothetical protein
MDVLGMDRHVVLQLMEVILTVLYGLDSMDALGVEFHCSRVDIMNISMLALNGLDSSMDVLGNEVDSSYSIQS